MHSALRSSKLTTMKKNDNVGKCGHARCAGGNGCYEKGSPTRSYENMWSPDICPSSLNEYGEPMTDGETAHRWAAQLSNDDYGKPVYMCEECGATKEPEAA